MQNEQEQTCGTDGTCCSPLPKCRASSSAFLQSGPGGCAPGNLVKEEGQAAGCACSRSWFSCRSLRSRDAAAQVCRQQTVQVRLKEPTRLTASSLPAPSPTTADNLQACPFAISTRFKSLKINGTLAKPTRLQRLALRGKDWLSVGFPTDCPNREVARGSRKSFTPSPPSLGRKEKEAAQTEDATCPAFTRMRGRRAVALDPKPNPLEPSGFRGTCAQRHGAQN